MRQTLLLSILLLIGFGPFDFTRGWLPSASLHAQNTYRVSQQYGYSATDATQFLQAALNDPTAAVIIVDADQGSTWITDGLLLTRDNVRIELDPGVTVRALDNALGQFESLLNIRGCSNVFVEGNGGTFAMDKSQYPGNSEFRHCIITRGAQNVTIQNLTLTGAAGDGIEVAPDFVVDANDVDGDGDVTEIEPVVPSRNITLNNLVCDANNRQGMSVISVIGLSVSGCTFSNTSGTLPESGVDFEPFKSYQFLQGITMTGCTFNGNEGNGIQFAGVDLRPTSPPVDITITGALVFDNGKDAGSTRAGVDINNTYDPFAGSDQTMNAADVGSVSGTFAMSNSTIRDEPYPGLNVRQYVTGLDVSFTNVAVENCANTFVNAGLGPIIVQPPSYDANRNNDPCFGNVAFNDVTLVDDQTNRAQVTVNDFRAGPSGPEDVTGTIDVTLTGAAAGTPINFNADNVSCANFTLAVVGNSGPLPVELAGFGVSLNGCTHEAAWEVASAELLTRFNLEASPDAETWTTAWTAAVSDGTAIGEHRARAEGQTARFYRLRSDFADGTTEYSDIVYAAGCGQKTTLSAWPNPSIGTLNITASEERRKLTFTSATGAHMLDVELAAGQTQLNLSTLAAGVYVLTDGHGGRQRIVVR